MHVRRIALAALLALHALPAVAQAIEPSRVEPALAAVLEREPAEVGVIVQFSGPVTEADGRAMLAAGFAAPMKRYTVVPAIYAIGPPSAVRSISRHPRVIRVEHDAHIPYLLDRSTTVTRAKPLRDASYTLAGEVHDDGITGRGVGIAIVDTGVDARHQDLLWKPIADATGEPAKTVLNLRIKGRNSTGFNPQDLVEVFEEPVATGIDLPHTDVTGGHGTHVAGIAAGNGRNANGKYTGTAPGAHLVGFGAGDTLVVHSGLAAFDWIHQHHDEYGIRVVNNSWGGAGEWSPEHSLTRAIRRLSNEDGIVMVFAAGNSGGDGTDLQTSVWGNIPEVIQVANYYDRTGWLDSSSSRGLATDETTWPDVAAPGTEIISTAALGGSITYFGSVQDMLISEIFGYGEPWVVPAQTPSPVETEVAGRQVIVGDYASFTGTSMAAPAVAGVVALVLEANPALTPAQVRTVLRETANMPPNRTYATDGHAIGRGVVDAAEAVAVALKMREGLDLEDAIAAASLDLTTSPPSVNAGTGPVTDNTIPLLPPPPPTITGNPQMFHGGVIDPAVLTGTYGFAPAEPVALAVRSLTSHDPGEAPLTAGNYTGAMTIQRDGEVVYGPFNAVIGSDSFGTRLSYDWTVPADAPPGTYVFDTDVTILSTGTTYDAAELSFFVTAPG